jgi:hypothetical protein
MTSNVHSLSLSLHLHSTLLYGLVVEIPETVEDRAQRSKFENCIGLEITKQKL